MAEVLNQSIDVLGVPEGSVVVLRNVRIAIDEDDPRPGEEVNVVLDMIRSVVEHDRFIVVMLDEPEGTIEVGGAVEFIAQLADAAEGKAINFNVHLHGDFTEPPSVGWISLLSRPTVPFPHGAPLPDGKEVESYGDKVEREGEG